MKNVSGQLPARLREYGLILTTKTTDKTTKFVLEDKGRGYRGFTYVRAGRDADGSLKDLYHNYLYETGANISLVSKH